MTQRSAYFRSGFTIVEVLCALAIMAVVLAAIGFALQNAIQSARYNAHQAETRHRSYNGLNYILNQVRQAREVELLDSSGNPITDPGVSTAAILRVTKSKNPLNGDRLKWSTIELNTDGGRSVLQVTSEAGVSNPALESVESMTFTSPMESDGTTRREVAVNIRVRIADVMAANDTTKSRIINLQGTEVARCVIKP